MADLPIPPKKKTRVKGPVSGTPLKRAAPRPYAPAKSGPKTVTRSAGDISGNPILRAAPRPYAPAKAGPGRQMMARPKAMPKGMPTPNSRAMERANPNARFKRGDAKAAAGRSTALAKGKVPVRGKGGIDLPKFASEVSGNYAKGVARVGGEVNKAAAQVGGGVDKAIAGVRKLAGSNAGINNAMKTGADKNNPLHRILSGKAKP